MTPDYLNQGLFDLLSEHFAQRLPYGERVKERCHIEISEIAGPNPFPMIEIRVFPYGKPA